MTVRVLQGDCRDVLKTLPDESVHCVVTSPPYFGLRDYGVTGQIGLEGTPEAFVAELVKVFADARRVLRSDGTLWLNLGDSYVAPNGRSSGGSYGRGPNSQLAHMHEAQEQGIVRGWGTLPAKNLVGVPWRVAFALQAAGWWLRQDIIWAKPNPMPESIRDRATKAHEYLFLLAKSERYYFDFEAFSEPRVGTDDAGVAGWASGDTPHSAIAHNRQKGDAKTFRGGQYVNDNKFQNSHATERSSTGNQASLKTTRNRRSVWTIATEAFDGAHFATFPTALVEPCILAGCPERTCGACGTALSLPSLRREDSDFSVCPSCNAALDEVGVAPGVVLDCFGGAGTTGLVADRHKRNAILIELNPEYAEMARNRITNDSPLFAEVE